MLVALFLGEDVEHLELGNLLCYSFLMEIIRFVLCRSMLHALERQFLMAFPFLLQNLSTSPFPHHALPHVLIKKLFLDRYVSVASILRC